MKVVGVIPARFGSTRFPGKPLALISGKPLLQHVIEGSQRSRALNSLIVATDDIQIADLARSCGVDVCMTDSWLPTGSDRVWQAISEENYDVVVNIQGDEPLIQPDLLDALVAPLSADPTLEMTTLGRPMDEVSLRSSNTAKIVLNHKDEALYFSRWAIPYSRKENERQSFSGCLKHIGLYAYRKNFLEKYCAHPPVEIELLEGLEQLRALYLGARIQVVRVDFESWGVDTPEDVYEIEKRLEARVRRHHEEN